MAEKMDHVLPRDGSQNMGQPFRPTPAPRPPENHVAETGIAKFGGSYSDKGYVGQRDERANFEAARGTPSPRQKAGAPQVTKSLPPAPIG